MIYLVSFNSWLLIYIAMALTYRASSCLQYTDITLNESHDMAGIDLLDYMDWDRPKTTCTTGELGLMAKFLPAMPDWINSIK